MISIVDAATTQVIAQFQGHAGEVFSLSWHPDGTTFASGGADGLVKIWDRATLTIIRVLPDTDPKPAVLSLVWNHSGSKLAAGNAYGLIQIWDEQGVYIEAFTHHEDVTSLAWSSDDILLMSGSRDGDIVLWNTTTRSRALRIEGFVGIQAADLSPDQSRIASSSISTVQQSSIEVWNTAIGNQVSSIESNAGDINVLKWSPDGQYIASGSRGGEIAIWNASTEQSIQVIQEANPVYALDWSPDGTQLAYGNEDGRVEIIATEDALAGTSPSHIYSLAWSPDGSEIAGAGANGITRIWNADTGQNAEYYIVEYSPSGNLIAGVKTDQQFSVWDSQSGNLVVELSDLPFNPFAIAWSPDGKRIVAAGGDNIIRVWCVDNSANPSCSLGSLIAEITGLTLPQFGGHQKCPLD